MALWDRVRRPIWKTCHAPERAEGKHVKCTHHPWAGYSWSMTPALRHSLAVLVEPNVQSVPEAQTDADPAPWALQQPAFAFL